MHFVKRSGETVPMPHPVYEGHSTGYARSPLIDHTTGSVHTGFSLNQLEVEGIVTPHLHSYEESFYVLAGEMIVGINGQAYRLGPGDYGVTKVGTLHSCRNAGTAPVRWLTMAAPQPKPIGKETDTFFVKDGHPPDGARLLDLNDLNGSLLGHFDVSQIPPPAEGRIAGGGLTGVFLKWLVDEAFGARHHRLLFIEYQPGVSIGLHDHTFEEGYFILNGEVEATMDGERYLARAGDVLWTSVGCVHAFANVSNEPVRWLETFAPQPPTENVFRFTAEWEQRSRELHGP